MRLLFTEAAERDLEELGDYIATDSPRRAVSFLQEIRDACLGLLETPLRFAQLDDVAASGLRRRIHGRYAIIYKVVGEDVVVVRILSASMDLKAILSDTR